MQNLELVVLRFLCFDIPIRHAVLLKSSTQLQYIVVRLLRNILSVKENVLRNVYIVNAFGLDD